MQKKVHIFKLSVYKPENNDVEHYELHKRNLHKFRADFKTLL